jgi:hypothetical protein
MSKSLSVVPRSTGLFAALRGDSTSTEVAAAQKAAFVERVHDSLRRDLHRLKMDDIGELARIGIDHAADVSDRMAAAVERNPLAARSACRIAETAVHGLDRELAQFINGD